MVYNQEGQRAGVGGGRFDSLKSDFMTATQPTTFALNVVNQLSLHVIELEGLLARAQITHDILDTQYERVFGPQPPIAARAAEKEPGVIMNNISCVAEEFNAVNERCTKLITMLRAKINEVEEAVIRSNNLIA